LHSPLPSAILGGCRTAFVDAAGISIEEPVAGPERAGKAKK
jgi:hypothetical protein